MKNPCQKDCPDRTPGCKIECSRWAEYQEALQEARERRDRERILDRYTCEALNDNRKRYGWKNGRPKL